MNPLPDISFMSKKFRITSLVCLALFVVFNVQRRYFSGPPAKVGVSGWRSEGFPFPYRVENVTHTMSGPVITLIRQDPCRPVQPEKS